MLRNQVKRCTKPIVFATLGLIVFLLIVFAAIPMFHSAFDTTPLADLPTYNHLAYKAVGRTNGGYMAYRVYTIEGWTYNLTEADWNTLRLPLRISDNLYRLPDGNYVTGITK